MHSDQAKSPQGTVGERLRTASGQILALIGGATNRKPPEEIPSSATPSEDGEETIVKTTKSPEAEGESPSDPWECKVCHVVFDSSKAKLLECEICFSHTCASCLKLTNAQYLTTQQKDLYWVCGKKCQQAMAKAAADARMNANGYLPDMLEKIATMLTQMQEDTLKTYESRTITATTQANAIASEVGGGPYLPTSHN
jgi:hypothetical protein